MDIIEKFKNKEFGVNCETKNKAIKFIKICDENGLSWCTGRKYSTWFSTYGEDTTYTFGDYYLVYGSYEYYIDSGLKVISYDEFMEEYDKMKKFTKDDLKVGMLVEFKNDIRKVVMPNKNGLYLMGCDTKYELYEFDDDLKHIDGDDIVKVYDLPNYSLSSEKYKNNIYCIENRKLLWKREKIKEMTVDEISEALGYKVKVVGGR